MPLGPARAQRRATCGATSAGMSARWRCGPRGVGVRGSSRFAAWHSAQHSAVRGNSAAGETVEMTVPPLLDESAARRLSAPWGWTLGWQLAATRVARAETVARKRPPPRCATPAESGGQPASRPCREDEIRGCSAALHDRSSLVQLTTLRRGDFQLRGDFLLRGEFLLRSGSALVARMPDGKEHGVEPPRGGGRRTPRRLTEAPISASSSMARTLL